MNICNRNFCYDPSSGRFVQKEPIGLKAGDTNLYRYVGNNPVLFVDPSGLKIEIRFNRGHFFALVDSPKNPDIVTYIDFGSLGGAKNNLEIFAGITVPGEVNVAKNLFRAAFSGVIVNTIDKGADFDLLYIQKAEELQKRATPDYNFYDFTPEGSNNCKSFLDRLAK